MTVADSTGRGADARPRVLVIEDDPGIAALVAYQLTRSGYHVETAANGLEGLDSLHRELPDLVVLTAKREETDRIEGLEMGADDYLTKPRQRGCPGHAHRVSTAQDIAGAR